MTLVRAGGMVHMNIFDSVWETYWNFLATEVGVILASLAAFRTLFVAHVHARAERRRLGWVDGLRSWPESCRRLLRIPGRRARTSTGGSGSGGASGGPAAVGIPRGEITGLRTYIDGAGRTLASHAALAASSLRGKESFSDA